MNFSSGLDSLNKKVHIVKKTLANHVVPDMRDIGLFPLTPGSLKKSAKIISNIPIKSIRKLKRKLIGND